MSFSRPMDDRTWSCSTVGHRVKSLCLPSCLHGAFRCRPNRRVSCWSDQKWCRTERSSRPAALVGDLRTYTLTSTRHLIYSSELLVKHCKRVLTLTWPRSTLGRSIIARVRPYANHKRQWTNTENKHNHYRTETVMCAKDELYAYTSIIRISNYWCAEKKQKIRLQRYRLPVYFRWIL